MINEWAGALEELNLSLSLTSRDKLGDFRKTKELDGEDYLIHVFLVQGIDPEKLELREGKAIRFLEKGESLEGIKLTRITSLAIENYFRSREIEKG